MLPECVLSCPDLDSIYIYGNEQKTEKRIAQSNVLQ